MCYLRLVHKKPSLAKHQDIVVPMQYFLYPVNSLEPDKLHLSGFIFQMCYQPFACLFHQQFQICISLPATCAYSVLQLISMIFVTFVLSICRKGKNSSRSLKVKMPSSFFRRSPRKGPTPFKYSMGFSNMEAVLLIKCFYKYRLIEY